MERRANRPRRPALLLQYWSSARETCPSCGLWSHPALSRRRTAGLRPRALPFPASRSASSRRSGSSAIPALRLRDLGREAVVHGQPTCSGVALPPREQTSLVAGRRCRAVGGPGRAGTWEVVVRTIAIGCPYLPHSNLPSGAGCDGELAWIKKFKRHAATLLKSGHPIGPWRLQPRAALDKHTIAVGSWKDNALLQPRRAEIPIAKATLARTRPNAGAAPQRSLLHVHKIRMPS